MARYTGHGRGAIKSKQFLAQSNNTYNRTNTISAVDVNKTVLYQSAGSTSAAGDRKAHVHLEDATTIRSASDGYAQPTSNDARNYTEIIEYN